jgi:tetratricopeptide (TPR) repeat protein
MNAPSQSAENIYNVNGNLILENTAEAVFAIHMRNQEKLKGIYSISFAELLDRNFKQKALINRKYLLELIHNELDKTNQLVIYGEPGIGKTALIYEFSKNITNTIYISVKGKSSLTVLSYIINRIKIENNVDFIEIHNIEEAQSILISELRNTKQLFIIDDCEQNTEVAKMISDFEKFDASFIYATRNEVIFRDSAITNFSIPAFEEHEAKLFLEVQNINLGTIGFNELFVASRGNPLYLFYFSQYQLSPLPKDIIGYQESIWNKLSSRHKEILVYISLAHFSITIEEVSSLFSIESIIDFIDELEGLKNLINNKDGILEIFHPSFIEHISAFLLRNRLTHRYSKTLGDFYLSKGDIVQACYLLADTSPDSIDEHILTAFPTLVDLGELEFAIKLLKIKLGTAKEDVTKGYIHYNISNISSILGKREDATHNIDAAIELLKNTKNNVFYLASLMARAMNFAERGDFKEAINLADDIFSKVKKKDKAFKAMLLVNLSKIYINLFEFTKAAEVSKEAFNIFAERKFKEGMLSSFVNLMSSLAQVDGYEKEAELYALKILGLISSENSFAIELIALNVLTGINRRNAEYAKAKEYGSNLIKLCQKYGLKTKMVLNLINYGNIFRDEGDLKEAKRIYNEALMYAEEYALPKEKARIYWLLSGMYRMEGDYHESISLADKSVRISEDCNFTYGIANALQQKASSLENLGLIEEAALTLEQCSEHYNKLTDYNSDSFGALSKAAALYSSINDQGKLELILSKLIYTALPSKEFHQIPTSLVNAIDDYSAYRYFDNFVKLYFKNNLKYNIVKQLLAFANYCNNHDATTGKKFFKSALNTIIDNIGTSKFAVSLLGISIVQSKNILDENDILHISRQLAEKFELFSIRQIDKTYVYICSISNTINIELTVPKNDLISFKIGLCILLMLYQDPSLVVSNEDLKNNDCGIFIFPYSVINNYESDKKSKYPFKGMAQSALVDLKNNDIQVAVVISPEYESYADIITNTESKSLLYLMVSTIGRIKEYFYDKKIMHSSRERKIIMDKVGYMLDYLTSDAEAIPKEFCVDMSKLD